MKFTELDGLQMTSQLAETKHFAADLLMILSNK